MSWKLQSISSFHQKFDVPCVKKISFALPCCEMRKNVFIHALLRHENVKRKQTEVISKSHCGTENCKRCWVEDNILARNWWDRFLATPRSNARRLQCSVLNWKHFSSRAQLRFLSRMEHQTFDENLKSTEVSTRVISMVYCSMSDASYLTLKR
jgi:hypothetical protein